jgi:hypothetical protein
MMMFTKASRAKTQLLSLTVRSYHENVIDHYEHPRNVGSLDKTKSNVGTGLVGAPACGDVMKLQIEVNGEDVIENAVFKVKSLLINRHLDAEAQSRAHLTQLKS